MLMNPPLGLVGMTKQEALDAQEFVNLVALAMRVGVTATQLRDGTWTHPSTTEALNEVLAELS